jgi:Tfp pilus assembly protein FimT
MLRNRKGLTMLELMTVLVLVVAVTAISFPKLKETRRAASMQSARTQVKSYLSIARSIAVRNGVRAVLIRNGNTLKIMADSTTGLVVVVRPIQLDSVSNVTLGATKDTLIYDARGIATNLSASGEKFYITAASGLGAGTKDSICVTRLGVVLDRSCGLVVVSKPLLDSLGNPIDILPIDKGGVIDLPPAPPLPY